jgi:hypothetical protein
LKAQSSKGKREFNEADTRDSEHIERKKEKEYFAVEALEENRT